MKHHPEQLEDEIYMGNSTLEDMLKSSWKTSRLGEVALMANGQPIDWRGGRTDLKPWFIKVSEVEQSIENERLNYKPWSAERIRTLQPMIDERTCFVETK